MLLSLVWVLLWPGVSLAQFDICGCRGNPNSLGAFDSANEATYPPGTTRDTVGFFVFSDIITIPLPPDGILIFGSFWVQPFPNTGRSIVVRFQRNAANTPVTLLVTGDVTIDAGGGLSVNGNDGTNGSNVVNGIGGLGGPGGFRGGDGAYQLWNFASDGGNGLGPGGGTAGTAVPLTYGSGGTFVGVAELLPLFGGSGGGGGASSSNQFGCSAGGGGGGGEVILGTDHVNKSDQKCT